jgi:hypothetical protein
VVARRGSTISTSAQVPEWRQATSRYAWVNTSLFVGEGRVIEGLGVEYRVARVT